LNYNIIIYNDDFTPFLFVVELLVNVLNFDETKAILKVKEIEKNGFIKFKFNSYEISEAKALELKDFVKYHNFDLKIIFEKDNDVK